MRVEAALTPNELKAKNQVAMLSTKFLRSHMSSIKGLDIKQLSVVHSWSTGAAKKYANPKAAYTLLVPCTSHILSMYSLRLLMQAIKILDKDPLYPEVVATPAGMFVSLGFYADLRLLENLTDI
jgi:hypothetical protein